MRLVAVLLVVFGFVTPASAEPFTGTEVENFITSVEKLRAQEDALKPLGDTVEAEAKGDVLSYVNESGDFVGFQKMMVKAQQSPVEYAIAEKAILQSGFSSVGAWAKLGDRLTMAYMASEISDQDREDMAAINPATLTLLPADARGPIMLAMLMVKASGNVSKAELASFLPYKQRLEDAFSDD